VTKLHFEAVVLTRSDRYLTTEMTRKQSIDISRAHADTFLAFNLTSWGYNYITVDPKDGSYGGMFSKLLLRELPDYYKPSSGHAHFPFVGALPHHSSADASHSGFSHRRPRNTT
jgi:linoleate 10R-lipoxygenase